MISSHETKIDHRLAVVPKRQIVKSDSNSEWSAASWKVRKLHRFADIETFLLKSLGMANVKHDPLLILPDAASVSDQVMTRASWVCDVLGVAP